MEGLVFDLRMRRLAAPALLGRVSPRAALLAPPAELRSLGRPSLPSPSWARLRPIATGVCGSDVVEMSLQADFDNPLRRLIGFPHVLGHEIVAEVLEPPSAPPPGAAPVRAGDIVVVDPWLGCEVREVEPCDGCAAGLPPRCVHAGEALPGAGGGMHLGNVAGLPGGFGSELVAHASRLHPLPAGMTAAHGILADPLAVAIHAVERAGIDAQTEHVLVLGAGTIGLCVTAVLRARHPGAVPLVTARWPHLAEEVRRLGGVPLPVGHAAAAEAVRAACGGRQIPAARRRPWLLGGGAAVVIDTIAAADTAQLALAAAAPGARVVEVGVHRPRRTETTLRYYKEVEVRGANGYGRTADGRHAIDVALDLLAGGDVPAARWLTHRYPLRRWREAFATAASPGRTGAIKVTIVPTEEPAP